MVSLRRLSRHARRGRSHRHLGCRNWTAARENRFSVPAKAVAWSPTGDALAVVIADDLLDPALDENADVSYPGRVEEDALLDDFDAGILGSGRPVDSAPLHLYIRLLDAHSGLQLGSLGSSAGGMPIDVTWPTPDRIATASEDGVSLWQPAAQIQCSDAARHGLETAGLDPSQKPVEILTEPHSASNNNPARVSFASAGHVLTK